MAGGPPSMKEEIEMCIAGEVGPGSHGKTRDQLVIAEMMEHGSWSLGAPQRRQKLEPKASGSSASQTVWTMGATRPKKKGHQLQKPRMSRETVHGSAHPQEYPGSLQGMRFHYERQELHLECSRQGPLHMITGRLRALEDQGATWRHREAVFFTMLVSACIANLWLWMRQ
ncbi:fetal and adult testis-expressed transcript protein [Marmota flaviventris]|uniref:fetal and adult testis-expressed transcript protein n=1 Tax=Marmota flaviventris TaxID=93162 RepID=UPI003A8BF5E9